ncbi:hypothetical protein GCM10023189_02670 [Nibrella saemangeumensis]|uniref:Uncharacterized protein n=1 Tax=Nibrella saemangeumensis TaxID=1084526 RepID=A0ABP8MC18_9BACT
MPATVALMAGVVSVVLHRYVFPPDAVSVVLGLAQLSVAEDGLMLAIGVVFSTATVLLVMAVQPLTFVTVNEYVVVLTGEMLITAEVSVVLHRYVPPPLAVRLTVGLAQVAVAEPGAILAVGEAFPVTTIVEVFVQFELRFVTVNVKTLGPLVSTVALVALALLVLRLDPAGADHV